jgi:hypothetical protein
MRLYEEFVDLYGKTKIRRSLREDVGHLTVDLNAQLHQEDRIQYMPDLEAKTETRTESYPDMKMMTGKMHRSCHRIRMNPIRMRKNPG